MIAPGRIPSAKVTAAVSGVSRAPVLKALPGLMLGVRTPTGARVECSILLEYAGESMRREHAKELFL